MMKNILFNIMQRSKDLWSNHKSKNGYDIKKNGYLYGILHTLILFILLNIFKFKSIIIFYIIATFFYILYLILDLFTLFLFVYKKLTIPSYLPDYLRNYLLNKQFISRYEVQVWRIFIYSDIRNLLTIILSFIFMIYMYIY